MTLMDQRQCSRIIAIIAIAGLVFVATAACLVIIARGWPSLVWRVILSDHMATPLLLVCALLALVDGILGLLFIILRRISLADFKFAILSMLYLLAAIYFILINWAKAW